MVIDLAHAPHWLLVVIHWFLLAWLAATAITTALRAVPEPSFQAFEKAWPAFGHLLRAVRKFGTDVVPFLASLGRAAWMIFRAGVGVGMLPVAFVLLGSGALVAGHGCGAPLTVGATGSVTTPPGGGQTWTIGVQIALGVAHQALPPVAAALAADPALNDRTRADVAHAFALTEDAVDVAIPIAAGLTAVLDGPTACRLHAAVDAALSAALQAFALARAAGATLPPLLEGVCGMLGVLNDTLAPGCIAQPADGVRAARITGSDRVRTVLAGGAP